MIFLNSLQKSSIQNLTSPLSVNIKQYLIAMKNKLIVLLLCSCISMLISCAGNQPPKQGNDTVSKADATKDTLNIDTNKNAGNANTIKTPNDTVKKALPKQ